MKGSIVRKREARGRKGGVIKVASQLYFNVS